MFFWERFRHLLSIVQRLNLNQPTNFNLNMKKTLITLLLFVPLFINAQSFWSVVADDDNNISRITDKGLLQDSIILVSGIVNDAPPLSTGK